MKFLIQFFGVFGRQYPFMKGTYYLAHHVLFKKICKTSPLKVKLKNGIKLKVDPTDFNGRVVALFGLQEPNILKICTNFLQYDDVFFDIGANNGVVGLNCINFANEIHLFEPQPYLCMNIRDCIKENNLDNVTLHPIGLMDHDDELNMHIIENHSGTGSFVRNHSDSTIKVAVKQASNYIKPLLKGRSFGAKVDVEGAEGKILPELLMLPNMRFIIFECQDKCEFWDLIKGRELLGIESSWIEPKFTRINVLADMDKYEDFIIIGEKVC